MLIKRITAAVPLTMDVCIPASIFHFDNVVIPLFNEKIHAFEQLKSVSFSDSSPSILWHSIDRIFNALYELRVDELWAFEL